MGKNKSEDNVPRIKESPINFSMTVASTIAGLYSGYCAAQGTPLSIDDSHVRNQLIAVPMISKSIVGGIERLMEVPTIHTGNSLGDRIADVSMGMCSGAFVGLVNGLFYFTIGYTLGYVVGSGLFLAQY